MTKILTARDPHGQRRAIVRQATARRHEPFDQRRLVVADLMIGTRNAMEDVSEARQVPRLAAAKLGQRPFDLTKAIDRRIDFFVASPNHFNSDTHPPAVAAFSQHPSAMLTNRAGRADGRDSRRTR